MVRAAHQRGIGGHAHVHRRRGPARDHALAVHVRPVGRERDRDAEVMPESPETTGADDGVVASIRAVAEEAGFEFERALLLQGMPECRAQRQDLRARSSARS